MIKNPITKLLGQMHLMEPGTSSKAATKNVKYPGVRDAIDGNTAVILVEREASDAAGAYPITPSTQMGEYWAEAVAAGHVNISGRPLIFLEPESEHAAAGVTAGMSMTGLRAVNFTSAQGLAFMHESLYGAVGKRLPYVLNLGCRAITKATLNVHCGHDDYHCADDTGFIQVFAKSAQEAADLNLIARKTAELSLTPAMVAMDGFLTTHLIEPVLVPEKELVAEFLGRPDDLIDTPTPAQAMIYGPKRRRVPVLWDVDTPMVSGAVANQDAHMQATAAQRPYFFDHIPALLNQCMAEYGELTGRQYSRVDAYRCDDAEYLILGMGSMCVQAEAVADWLRDTRKLKVGVVNLTTFRPFPGDVLGQILKGKKGVAVLERTDQPLSEDLPLMREVRATVSKCLENGSAPGAYPGYAAYTKLSDMPRLYSGCYGLGSRDLQPEGLLAAIENMLDSVGKPGAHKKFYYLSIDFIRDQAANPKQEIHQQEILAAYPKIKELALRGSENPNLLPQAAIAVRMHSVGGWGAVTTGKNLAMTIYELLGWDIKANPKYGSEKKGQPTTYFLSAAPEPIRVNCEYTHVDVVLSPDPQVFLHTNAVAGLKKNGVLVIQSNLPDAAAVWATFPIYAQKYIAGNDIKVFYLDAFTIAREESSNPDLQLRMQGNAFQGAFFHASDVQQRAGLNEEILFKAIENQLNDKFGKKGKRIVDDNLRVVKRGYTEIHEIPAEVKKVGAREPAGFKATASLPIMLKRMPENDGGLLKTADTHRFWEQTGSFYMSGKGSDNLADPFMGMALIPAVTGVYRDMTQIRFEHPQWIAENCTACGNCYTQCPDSAIPGLVSTVGDVLNTAISNIEMSGRITRFLRKGSRVIEKKLRGVLDRDGLDVRALLKRAIEEAMHEDASQGNAAMEEEYHLLGKELGEFQFATTKPYWANKEKKGKGSGGLFSITVNPYTCKGCALCVDVCEDDALKMVTQTDASIVQLRQEWDFWLNLPTTPKEYNRIDDLDEKIGALETLLLDKQNYSSMACGDGACLGCGEKTAIHIFTGTVTALMQPRVAAFLEKINGLIDGLEKHLRMKLTESVNLSDTGAMMRAVAEHQGGDLTLANLSVSLMANQAAQPIDPQWLKWVTQLLARLKDLKWRYVEGPTKRGRAEMGIVNSTGCTSVWGSTFPFNPYPFPWTSHLFQDSPSVAMGVFEGHMSKMADGFKAVRMAEVELGLNGNVGGYNPAVHEAEFTYFNWEKFSEEEWHLCPPVVAVGGDGAMYDIGFQNLSRALMTGMPVKILVVDTQVYSNTGGQACTSGFIGQVADMSPYGKKDHGKKEIRKEISVIGMAHRTAFVAQSAISSPTHLIESYIDGLNSRRPALFNIYAVCPPEHGVGDDMAVERSKLAVESRAYPLFRYDPDQGTTFSECVSLEGNPEMDAEWPSYTLAYKEEDGSEQKMELPMTFADFALGEGRFAKQFKKAPPDTWNDDMVLLADFLKLDIDGRDGKFPYIWAVDKKQRLMRVIVSAELVNSCEERQQFWQQLKDVAGLNVPEVDEKAIADRARAELLGEISASLAALGGGFVAQASSPAAVHAGETPALQGGALGDAVYIDTPECTACDECTTLAPKVFAYNSDKQATVINPQGAKFADIVKAAEKCTAGCLHPGTPWNMAEPNVDKLIARAAKYN